MTKQIPLTQGKFAIVDDEDFDYLINFKWYLNNYGYAFSSAFSGGRYKTVLMHRLIMNTPHKMETDHKNHDRLDNRRKNLRLCTTSQNQGNRKQKSSLYKGVTKKKYGYQARIAINGKASHIGFFKSPKEAATAYNTAAIAKYGEFALLNIIE